MQASITPSPPLRVRSVDYLRGVTIFLMIYFNTGVIGSPWWLEHYPKNLNGMTIVDVIFPSFLMIMGISIPYALGAQIEKGSTALGLLPGILFRSLSLMLMGVLDVGVNHPACDRMGLTVAHWSLGVYLSFLFVWHTIHCKGVMAKSISTGFRVIGILYLAWYAWIFQGDNGGWLTSGWWGILGILGWSYLIASLVYLALRNQRDLLMLSAFVSVLYYVFQYHIHPDSALAVPGTGSLWGGRPCIVIFGVVVGVLLRDSLPQDTKLRWLSVFAILCAVIAAFWEPAYGIGKVRSTPTWIFASLAITAIGLVVAYDALDVRGVAGRISTWLVDCGKVPLCIYILHPVVIDVMKIGSIYDVFMDIGRYSYGLGIVATMLVSIIVCSTSIVLFRKYNFNIRA